MPNLDEILGNPKPANPEQQRRRLMIVAMKRAVEETFDASKWTELGLLTNSADVLSNHPRLYRSLSFGDDDYGACVLDVLPAVLGPNFEYEQDVATFVGLDEWLKENDPKLHARLFGGSVQLKPQDLSALADPGAIEDHLRRIQLSVVADPGHAIGVAKELIESTAKLVLDALGEPFDDKADVPTPVKQAQSALALHPSTLAPTTKGAESVRRILAGLSNIAVGVAELRNLYGTGHGKTQRVAGLGPRHAQLAVDAASTYCRALLATLADPSAPWRRRSR
jgi:AbiJ N-terminal domain 5/Abortive infection C-terminus